MKWFIIAGIVAAALVALLIVVNPILVAVSSEPGSRIESKVSLQDGGIVCELLLQNAKTDHYVTELDIKRPVAEMMKIGNPDGFRLEALPATESDDKEWVENWNRENVRFTGRFKITPGVAVTLFIPAVTPALEGLEIGGQFETGRKFGNTISFFTVKPSKTEPNQSSEPMPPKRHGTP
jgi:hypothetical protein